MLGEVAGEAHQRAREIERQPQPPVFQVQVQFGGVVLLHALVAPAPDLGCEHAGDVVCQAERLAHVADGATAAVADDGRAEGRTVTAVGLVDPLDDFLAPFVLEIDVDIGRLLAFGADEAFEQQVGAGRIDRGDAEDIAHRGVGGGPATLAQDVPGSGVAHDAIDGKEVGCIVELRDQLELVAELLGDCGRDSVRKPDGGTFPSEAFECLLGGEAGKADLVRILVSELVERKGATRHDLLRAGECIGVALEQPFHFMEWFQCAVSGSGEAETGFVDAAAFADAGEHVLQDAALRGVVEHVAGRDRRDAGLPGLVFRALQADGIIGAALDRKGDVGAVFEGVLQAVERLEGRRQMGLVA